MGHGADLAQEDDKLQGGLRTVWQNEAAVFQALQLRCEFFEYEHQEPAGAD